MGTTLGYQGGSQLSPEEQAARAKQMGAGWMRIIATTKDDPAKLAENMRAAKRAGQKVILTIGGTGTSERKPGVKATKALIAKLPQADKYTWTNEADISGRSAANYGRGWMQLRKGLGNKLLWGDFSPHAPLTYTQKAQKAVRLPGRLQFAVHPYQRDDPMAPDKIDPGWQEGALGDLGRTRAALRKGGIKADYWLTEFGYDPAHQGQWARALERAKQLKARMINVYDVKGPTWDTGLSPEAVAAIAARKR